MDPHLAPAPGNSGSQFCLLAQIVVFSEHQLTREEDISECGGILYIVDEW